MSFNSPDLAEEMMKEGKRSRVPLFIAVRG